MSSITTLAELRSNVRERADMEKSKFVSDAKVNMYINYAIAKLHDLLIDQYGEEYEVKDVTFNTDGSSSYDLTSSSIIPDEDFYKVKGIDAKINSGNWSTIHPFQMSDRNKFQNGSFHSFLGASNIRYRIIGNTLRFMPDIDANIPIRIWYARSATKLSNDADILRDYNQYAELVEVDAAIQMKKKGDEDASDLETERLILVDRIEKSSQNRDAGEGDAVSDVTGVGEDVPVVGSS